MQTFGARQSALLAHVLLQCSQRPLLQECPGPQSVATAHDGGTHERNPSQTPPSAQRPDGSGAPFGTGVQVPIVPASAHEKQSCVQAVWQQTPWAQKPLLHSSFDAQAVSSPRLQVPRVQGRRAKQSSAVAQVVLQRPRATSQANGWQLKPDGPHG